MARKFRSWWLPAVLTLILLAASSIVTVGALVPAPPDDAGAWLAQNEFVVAVSGTGSFPVSGAKVVPFDATEDPWPNADAFVVTDNETAGVLSSPAITGLVLGTVKQGKPVAFLDSSANALRAALGSPVRETLIGGNVREFATYLWSDLSGAPRLGIVGATLDTGEGMAAGFLLEQLVNHRGGVNRNNPTGFGPERWADHRFVTTQARASAPDSLYVDANWSQRVDTEYNWITANGNKLNEWKRIWVWATETNQFYDWFLTRLDDQLVPANPPYRSNRLRIRGQGSSGQQLADYGPLASQGATTLSWTMAFGDGGATAYAGASWDVQNLTVYDSSDYSTELFDVLFQYDTGSAYAQGTSRQFPAWALKVAAGVNPGIYNYRKVEFYAWGSNDVIEQTYVTYPGAR